jgi:MFS superfamily sulfate permease-like transporter
MGARRLKQISTMVFVVASVITVLFVLAPLVGLRVPDGVIAAVLGTGIIWGMVLRSRAERVTSQPDASGTDDPPDE